MILAADRCKVALGIRISSVQASVVCSTSASCLVMLLGKHGLNGR